MEVKFDLIKINVIKLIQRAELHSNRVHNRLMALNSINEKRVRRPHRLLTLHPILLYTHLTLHAPPFILIHRFILLRTVDVYDRLVFSYVFMFYEIILLFKMYIKISQFLSNL